MLSYRITVFLKVSAFAAWPSWPLNTYSFPSNVYVASPWEFVFKQLCISCQTLDFNLGGSCGSTGNISNSKRSPTSEVTGGLINSTLDSSSVARTIASDFTPLIFDGFKLVKTTTRRSTICSRGINFTKPEHTCNGVSSWICICDTYKFSAFSWSWHCKILPTLKFKRLGGTVVSINRRIEKIDTRMVSLIY